MINRASVRSVARTEASRIVVALGMMAVPPTGTLAGVPSDYLSGMGWLGLSQSDLDRVNNAAALLYEGLPGATVERWSSPVSGKSGEVRLIGSFEFHGMACRKLDYTVVSADQTNQAHYVLSWCKVPDGAWKIVEVPGRR